MSPFDRQKTRPSDRLFPATADSSPSLDRDLKAELYAEIGLRVEYHPLAQEIAVELPLGDRWGTARVGGPRTPLSPQSIPRSALLDLGH